MIEARQLTKRRDGRSVVTFRREPGTTTGFLGPNGAGKTTTMRVLVGLSEPDSGEARTLDGRYRDPPSPRRRIDSLLELVGLDETAARRRVGASSLGMRQRLGFSHALLGEPELLILDESRQRPRSRGHALDARTGCAASPTTAAPRCSPRTCSPRSRPSPTG